MAINESRRAAMSNVWFLLIWLAFVSVESVIYNIIEMTMTDVDCAPTKFSQDVHDLLKLFDRIVNY